MTVVHNTIENLTEEQAALKRNRVQWFDSIKVPLGHVLSVLVEIRGDSNPNLKLYMNDLNQHIALGGNNFAAFKDLSEPFEGGGSKKLYGLSRYLWDLKLTQEQRDYVIMEARGIDSNYSRFQNK